MKNKLKLIISFSFIFLLLFLASCKKNNTIIEIYEGDSKTLNNQSYSINNSYEQYDDNHVLKLSFNLKIDNNTKKDKKLKIENPKAYGNDLLLKEEILETYNYNDKTDNKLFNNKEIKISKKDSYNLEFLLIIRDGNPLAKYKIEFNLNNIKTIIYSYELGYELNNFIYVHNPLYNSKVLDDAEYDSNTVFGFKPNQTGSLKIYADYNWCDNEFVNESKDNRIKYIEENDKRVSDLENQLKNEGKNTEEIARACSNLRNQIRLDQYKDDPEGLEQLKQRNLEKYGHEEGPLPDELYEKYNQSWETVLEKCYSTNAGMDACCGVYDMYFNMYTSFAY